MLEAGLKMRMEINQLEIEKKPQHAKSHNPSKME